MTLKLLGGTFGDARLEHTKIAYMYYNYTSLYFVIKEAFISLLNTKTVITYVHSHMHKDSEPQQNVFKLVNPIGLNPLGARQTQTLKDAGVKYIGYI